MNSKNKIAIPLTKAVVFLTAGLGGIGLISSSVYASLTAVASNTSGGTVTSGTLKLTQAPSTVVGLTDGFATSITAIAPGDTVRRYIDLSNTGTLDGDTVTLKAEPSVSNALTTNGTAGLQVTVNECAVAWTSAGVCTPGSTVVLSQKSLLAMGSAQSLTLSSVLASSVNHLQFVITLPAGSEVTTNGALPVGTVQGLSTALTWTFTETMRAATTTDS